MCFYLIYCFDANRQCIMELATKLFCHKVASMQNAMNGKYIWNTLLEQGSETSVSTNQARLALEWNIGRILKA